MERKLQPDEPQLEGGTIEVLAWNSKGDCWRNAEISQVKAIQLGKRRNKQLEGSSWNSRAIKLLWEENRTAARTTTLGELQLESKKV
ncbi:hypothetical protein HPP92_009705 [Vanilla planifolia]|uniref:Uncharacterized protein n=1 Tax=Vanilla planifolia TaxID=51239 RepID=A0A835RAJ2_VANPL|nr:hypothetical protein HPP92_009705 [Vanilla planifolia]